MMLGPKCILPLTLYEQKYILYITTYSVKITSSFFTKFFLLFSDILFIAIPQNNTIKTVQQSAKDKEDICRRADARQRYLTQDFTL